MENLLLAFWLTFGVLSWSLPLAILWPGQRPRLARVVFGVLFCAVFAFLFSIVEGR